MNWKYVLFPNGGTVVVDTVRGFIQVYLNGRKSKTSQLDDKTQLPFFKKHTSALISTRHFRAREANIGNKLDKRSET